MRLKIYQMMLAAMLFFSWPVHANVWLEDLDGFTISWASLKGKWVFINYWASWCEPCIHEIKQFNRLAQDEQVNVFAVNFDQDSIAKQRQMAKHFHIHYPSLTPQSVKALELAETSVVPVTFVFDPEGKLKDVLYGGQTERSLRLAMKG